MNLLLIMVIEYFKESTAEIIEEWAGVIHKYNMAYPYNGMLFGNRKE